MSDRTAQASAEAERRWFPGHDHGDCIKCGIDKQVREGFELGVEWADANPKPHTITRAELGDAAVETLARVRELHRPVDVEPSETICHECSTLRGTGENKRYFPYEEWPCATYQATEVDDDD